MKKSHLMLMLLATCCLFAKADVLVTEQMSAKKGAQVKGSVKAETYYIISGIDQSSVEHYLYDNGGQVKGSASFPTNSESTSSHIWTLKASDNGWVVVNVGTGMNMNLGSSNGSAIKTSQNEQVNAIHFASDGYVTILNSNGQAIDMTANGLNPTTWTGTTTPTGSRRLKIYAVEDVNTMDVKSLSLIPAPKSATVGDGEFLLQDGFTIAVGAFSQSDEHNRVLADVARFITTIDKSTGLSCKAISGQGDITIAENAEIASEGYIMDISTDGVSIEASSSDGVYYALQSLMRLLPPNVILGKMGNEGQTYALPVSHIEDEPRFSYRGFMLDVSRHFFTIEQVKKMIDLMAIYKMNVFHWHLTDDQGWRAEIKQYPLLTSTGAERRSSYDTPITRIEENGQVYWTGSGAQTNRKYGPFYYTQEEMKDVVRYAAERHIDILPEVDMPGHFVAALAAYPQFSCHPNSAPQVWINGGVSQDVLNVANPEAVQFAKNIITELCEIFPYPYFHIGGDECPTSQWESNAQCQAKLKELGKTSYRALQTEFIREINEHLATLGKKIFCWNESITDNGADLDLMKKSGATIMCWTPCQSAAAKAASMGLNAIITEYGTGCYYINRKQSTDYGEPSAAGSGNDHVAATYNYVPVPSSISAQNAKYYIGVQATFWTEHVSSNEYLEYLALPRFMCVAESGWSPQTKKDWRSFVRRMTVDTKMLDLGEYIYARHWMDNYTPRQAPASEIADGNIVTFTNQSADRGRCLRDDNGTLNGQGSECTQWVLEAASQAGQFYIRSMVSGKYLYAASSSSGTMVQLSTSKTAWAFDTTTMSGYVAICYNNTSGYAVNNNVNNTTKTRLFAHGSGNGASFWKIENSVSNELADGESGTLTYQYYYRGLVVGTKSFKLEKGSAYPPLLHEAYLPKGYMPLSKQSIQGQVHLVEETIEIPVEKIPAQDAFYHFYNEANALYLSTESCADKHGASASTQPHTIFYYANGALLSYERGLYVNGTDMSAEPGLPLTIEPSVRGTNGQCNIISNYNDFICMANGADAHNTLGTSEEAKASASYDFAHRNVLALPVSIPESGWATFSAPVPVTVPQACVAYVAESYDAASASLTMSAITPGTTIAANTGFILKATPSATVELVISESGSRYADNMLQPSVSVTTIPEDTQAYLPVCADGTISYRLLSATERTLPSHSSWLLMNDSNAPANLSVVLPETETGIDNIKSESEAKGGIYNLHGQKLHTPQPGLNIINGRKVVVK